MFGVSIVYKLSWQTYLVQKVSNPFRPSASTHVAVGRRSNNLLCFRTCHSNTSTSCFRQRKSLSRSVRDLKDS